MMNVESKQAGDSNAESLSNNYLGICNVYSGNYDSALYFLNISLNQRLKGDKNTRAVCDLYSNIGVCYDYKGDFASALGAYLKSLKIAEFTKDTTALAKLNNNIGAVYFQQREYRKSLDYFLQALIMRERLNETSGIATCCLNISNCYDNLKMRDEQDKYIEKCIRFAKLSSDSSILAESYSMIAERLCDKIKFKEAVPYFLNSINCYRSIGETRGMSDVLYQLGSNYFRLKEYKLAYKAMLESYSLAKSINYLSGVSSGAAGLAIAFSYLNKPDSTEHYIAIYRNAYDSLYSQNNAGLIAEMQTKYGTEKKDQENKLLTARNELAEQNAKKQRLITIFILVCMIAIAIVSFFIYYAYKSKKRANEKLELLNREILDSKEKIEIQKDMIEEKQKSIIESIYYAKRIQESLLPSKKYIGKKLKDLQKGN